MAFETRGEEGKGKYFVAMRDGKKEAVFYFVDKPMLANVIRCAELEFPGVAHDKISASPGIMLTLSLK